MKKKTIKTQAKQLLKNVNKETMRLENSIALKPESWLESMAHERLCAKIDVLHDFSAELEELLLDL